MIAIHKFNLPVEDKVQITMPADAKVLCVQTQRGVPKLWARVNTNNTPETRAFRVAGTGHKLDLDSDAVVAEDKYIGTFQLDGGSLIFHVFELT